MYSLFCLKLYHFALDSKAFSCQRAGVSLTHIDVDQQIMLLQMIANIGRSILELDTSGPIVESG